MKKAIYSLLCIFAIAAMSACSQKNPVDEVTATMNEMTKYIKGLTPEDNLDEKTGPIEKYGAKIDSIQTANKDYKLTDSDKEKLIKASTELTSSVLDLQIKVMGMDPNSEEIKTAKKQAAEATKTSVGNMKTLGDNKPNL